MVDLQKTRCAICGTEDNALELYPANFDFRAFTPAVFSARRLPDRIHYRLVRCRSCGLVRSDPIAADATLRELYAASGFDYGTEVESLKRTYGRYLAEASRHASSKRALLEIGCGNGFFLEEAQRQGYAVVRGVEPSAVAVAAAPPALRSNIVCGVMKPGLFEPEAFDAICWFQVLDHVSDPAAMLEECFRLLRPGGVILCLNHNVEAVSARLLGERSPIVDIEHTYLYSPATLIRLLTQRGFQVRCCGVAWNTYSLRYLARLLPMPVAGKSAILRFLGRSAIGRVRLSVPLGNLRAVGRKPVPAESGSVLPPTGARHPLR